MDFSPTGEGFRLYPRKVVRPGEVISVWEGGDVPFQGAETRGLSHWPTFQRRGDAAHLIEARVSLTADHLQEAGKRAGKEPTGLKVTTVAGRAVCGSFPGKREGRIPVLSTGNRNNSFHKVLKLRSKVDANAEQPFKGRRMFRVELLNHPAQCPLVLGRPRGGHLSGMGFWAYFPF